MPTRESKAEFEELLLKYAPPIRALAKKTRMSVLDVFPKACERTYLGWSNTWYGTTDKTRDGVFAISPQRAYVSLFFLRGTELADPEGLLEGAGKKLMHVNLRVAADLKRPALRRLMKRAVALEKKRIAI
jgi:hypothetical protein